MKRAIVTGSKGFIGKNLIQEIKDDFEILEINNREKEKIRKQAIERVTKEFNIEKQQKAGYKQPPMLPFPCIKRCT